MLVSISSFDSFLSQEGQWWWGTLVLKCPTSMRISTLIMSVIQDKCWTSSDC